jgi:MFS family permease
LRRGGAARVTVSVGSIAAPSRRTAVAVLAVCFAIALAGRGLIESFVVFLLPLGQSFGWDRAEVVSIYSLAMLASGLGAPAVGRLFDRSGPRTVYALGLVLLGAGLSLAPFADRLWQLQLCLGVGAGIAGACCGNVPSSALLSRWFRGRLAAATSIAYSGPGIGFLTIVPLAQLMIEHVGWRATYHWLGGAVLVLALPLLLLPWRRFAAGSPDLARADAAAAHEVDAATLLRAVRHPAFWGLFAVYFFTGTGMYAVAVQVVAYLIEIGFTPLEAATAWGLVGFLMPVGMIGVGWLDGLIGRRRSILLSYGCSLVGIGLLWLLGRVPNVALLGAFVVCFGSTLGSRGPLVSTIAMRLFRGGAVATIFGTIAVGQGLGAALGAWTGGLLHDWTHSYDLVLAFAFAMLVCGMLPFLTLRALRD